MSEDVLLTISILLEAFRATQTHGAECTSHFDKAKGMIKAAKIMNVDPLPGMPEIEKILDM